MNIRSNGVLRVGLRNACPLEIKLILSNITVKQSSVVVAMTSNYIKPFSINRVADNVNVILTKY